MDTLVWITFPTVDIVNPEEDEVVERLARLLHERGVEYTADSFHVLKEWDFEHPGTVPTAEHWVEQIPFKPAHIHIGDLPRNYPKADDPMMQGFAKRLREVGYDGRISLECSLGELETGLPAALKELRALFV